MPADVDRAEHGHDPRREPIARVGPGERAGGGENEADRDEQRTARVPSAEPRQVGDHGHRDDRPQDGQRWVTRRPKQPKHLDRGKDGDEQHGPDDPGPAEREHEDERRDQDRGAGRPLLEHPVRDQRPKRRVRLANSSSAASNASGPKSGQSTGHE